MTRRVGWGCLLSNPHEGHAQIQASHERGGNHERPAPRARGGSTIGDAPDPTNMMPNIAKGALISARTTASAGGRFARFGAVTIQATEPRANPTSTSAAHANRASTDGSLSMTMARSPREAHMEAATSPAPKVSHSCGWRAVRVMLTSPSDLVRGRGTPARRDASLGRPGGRSPRNAGGASEPLPVCSSADRAFTIRGMCGRLDAFTIGHVEPS